MSNNPNKFRFVCPPKDMMYLLFGRKNCPNCGEKLKKEKKFEINLYYKWKSSNRRTYYSPNGMPVKDIYYDFSCIKCGYIKKIGDLSDGDKTPYKGE